MTDAAPAPIGLLAELTHRCPLQCPYCSNPAVLTPRRDELDAETWGDVFRQAAALGVLQLHLSGGEPAARADLEAIVAAADATGLYANLITSGIGLTAERLAALQRIGLPHVQLSVQDALPASADAIAGHAGAHARKLALARAAVACGLALTINVVLHRGNLAHTEALVALAVALGAGRIELAHVQYHGWALANRGLLLPSAEQVQAWREALPGLVATYGDRIVIDTVTPDHYARLPKPCMGGWGRRLLVVTPNGRVLPCHAAESIPDLAFWSVRSRSLAEIWHESPAFQAFRGTNWMAEPWRSCDRREIDFGGCRCQALALAGDASAADPVCEKSPLHHRMAAITEAASVDIPRPPALRPHALTG